MGVTSFVRGDYGNKPVSGTEENKANQSQFRDDLMSWMGKIPQYEVSY